MDYKNNVKDQKALLEKHLNNINIIVTAKLGIEVKLEIKEKKDYRNQPILGLIDKRNLKSYCGIMESAFSNVFIENFGMWWREDGVVFDLHFCYEHINIGSNGAKFCTIQIKNDLIKID